MSTQTLTQTDVALLTSITERAFAQVQAMIWFANNREKRPGDPKVGGHPAACASALHILGALHLVAREVDDYVCCKPHASPVDHSYHNLLGLFGHEQQGRMHWLSEAEGLAAMRHLRDFAGPEAPDVFQSYHAKSDPDSFHFLPSGSVGIPPVNSVYLALAHRYARHHGYKLPPKAHYWSLMGDSEFREGSLFEAIPDVAERQLGNVTWMVDYNRQNLDGTRIPNERALKSRDCDRIQRTAEANGWKVIQVQHGALREQVFKLPGGRVLKELLEGGLSDYEYQILLFRRDPKEVRRMLLAQRPDAKQILGQLDDAQLIAVLSAVGGHDLKQLIEAMLASRQEPEVPYLLIVHTIKGWGLECFANPSNHSSLPSKQEVAAVLEQRGLSFADPFARFPAHSPEGEFLAARGQLFREGIESHLELRQANRAAQRARSAGATALPLTLDIDLKLFPMAHTQWMWGQLASKLMRIGTHGQGGPAMGGGEEKPLSEHELRWKPAAEFMLTLSPDVGTSTNIAPVLDKRIYGPDNKDVASEEFDARHPELITAEDAWTRHIRFEIAEANCMSAAGSFGKLNDYTGIPFLPVMTVYDFFIKRALDQLYYNLYWGAEFVIMGTPSGVTLAPEGAQHSWKSDIQIPNLITWEPLFAIEMDWVLSDAIRRHMSGDNLGRKGVLIRAVTRAIHQNLLLENLRRQKRFKQSLSADLLLCCAGDTPSEQVVDESTVPAQPDTQILTSVREDCLQGAYALIDWSGYAGYEPGDNVVQLFAMGSVATEAIDAARVLYEMGIFANLIVVSSPELLAGILGEESDYRHLTQGLGVNGDLHAVQGAGTQTAGLVSLAGRRVPIVAICDGEAGLLDNLGSIVGVKQRTLAVRKFSKCGRPDQVFKLQHLDCNSIVEAAGRALSETALEDLRTSPALLERLAGRAACAARPNWRELWPSADAH